MNSVPDYADLFENAPVGYMQTDTAGRIQRINRAGAAMLGWDGSWLTGKPFSRWVTNNDKQLFQVHQQQLRDCSECVSQDLRIKNRQGRIVSLRLESVREAQVANAAAGCRSVMVDISGEEQSARRLRYLQSQLAHVTRVHTAGELATSLAHELNQPLGTVVLNCEAALRLLNSGRTEACEFAEALTQAVEAASFASEIIRHLRGFLRQDGELHRVCTLKDLLHDVFTLIETDARDHDIELQFDIERGLPSVRVDPVQIEQVLVNLAHNSIEAMSTNGQDGAPGKVVIEVRQESPSRIRVSVEDTGPGLSPKQIERIFTPLYTTKESGMGMGLSISRTIIDAHGGRLWATSAAGHGAVIHFTLPAIAVEGHGS
ncbi:MAG: PAS domain-containing sensor histidine kinase [Gammaproteobacteria bacterium]